MATPSTKLTPGQQAAIDKANAAAAKKSAETEALLAAEANKGDLAEAARKAQAKKSGTSATATTDEPEAVDNAAEEGSEMEPQAPGKDAGLAEIAAYHKAMREYKRKKAEMSGAGKQSPYPK